MTEFVEQQSVVTVASQLRRSGTRRPWGPAARLAAVIALLLSNVSPAAAQPAWTGVVTDVSGESGSAIDLVSDAAGNAIAIWRVQPTSIRVAHFSAVTKVWGAPVALLSGYSAAIAMTPGGDAVVVWSESSTGSRVRATWYSASSATWSAPGTIASSAHGFGFPHVAVDAHGNATAIWEALGPLTHSHVQAARYTATTGVWSAVVNVTPLAYNGMSLQPRAVLDGSGHANAIFWTGPGGGRAMYASRSSADGTSWSSPQALRPGNGSSPLTLTVDAGGNAFAVWTAESAGGIAAARYAAATGAWGAVQTLSTAGFDPQVVVDDAGNATATWAGAQGQGSTIVSSSYSASSGTWSASQPIVTTTNSVGTMQSGLAVDGTGTVTAVWARYDAASRRTLMSASRRASGQPWTAPVTLAENNPGSSFFAAASRAGDVTVLSSTLRSTRWASTGAEAVSAPTALTVTTDTIWYGEAELGAPLTISWSAPQTGLPVTGYRLEAGTSPGASDLAVVDVGATTQVVTTVPPVRRVILRVRAISGAVVGPPSSENGFLVYGVCGAPAVPSGLTGTVSGGTVTLSWQAASGATTYVLEAGTASGLANLGSTNVGSATRLSATVPPGTYYVRVRGATLCGTTSGSSNEVVVTIAGAAAPGAPVLNPPTVNGSTVSLSWSAGSGNAPTAYTLSVTLAPGGPPVATAPLSGTSATFPGVPSGNYYLRLTASNAAGAGPPSAQVSLTVP